MRAISGIQPTGQLHIGNYLGAIKNWATLQDKYECLFFVADLHALTTPYDSQNFARQTKEKVAELLALGVDPERCVIFVQSKIKEHAELAWILNTLTPVAELERMIQYKERVKKFKQNVNAGLFTYPVLQAADILLYSSDVVPVGRDQKQHIELTQTIARRFNARFGQTLKEPEALIIEGGSKIMSLEEPKKKMSKSDQPQSYLGVFDEPKAIEKKIMSAVTDLGKEIKYDTAKKPGISNLLTIYSLVSKAPLKDIESKFKGRGYAKFKKNLIKLLVEELEPFRKKKREFLSREVYIDEIISGGTKKARQLAAFTMEEVRKKTGLI